ncbi:inositol polyphosphate-5-phosphatase A-like [Argiope bruennichi]|uniref:inositol-polyphosphate 5-phosphatase n=1 Tax=Argiope bruennichi TaxID=94029 RepID=A0A8T0FJU6_ARGBR|nr:inositol polyphosphate-5-phosphatase A-like [Argiope bruennichi]KAF8789083.1 Inositol polyphosphate-5-phosphatase A like protein [Argiope bruennichi]
MDELVSFLLVSANVGSIFEDPENLLKTWLKEFLLVVKRSDPKFLALHCQEVGGKNSKDAMKLVEEFVRALMTSEELHHFGQIRLFLDEDYTNPAKYTALGNLYFVHNSLKDVQIWDFNENKFKSAAGKEVHNGNIENVGTKEKVKFPLILFPESKFSRKGFMRTRWRIGCAAFDLVNIHLFHDACNFTAMEKYPSRYSEIRQTALVYTLQRFNLGNEKVPLFIFGDFNFRLDTKGIIQKLTKKAVPVYVKSAKNEVEKIVYKDKSNEDKVVLTLGKKQFELDEHEATFLGKEKWLQEFDKEPKIFEKDLFEFEISFPPSYPFEEDASGTSYMRTRCPSWCDRIFLTRSALSLINMTPLDNGKPPVVYQLVGEGMGMGDHKPVMLSCSLRCFPSKNNSNQLHGP